MWFFRRLYPCKFRYPSFPRGVFCVVPMEKRPHSLFAWVVPDEISKFCACNHHFFLKNANFGVPLIQGGWFVWYYMEKRTHSLFAWVVSDEVSKLGACNHFLFKNTQILAYLFSKGWSRGYTWKNIPFVCWPLWFKATPPWQPQPQPQLKYNSEPQPQCKHKLEPQPQPQVKAAGESCRPGSKIKPSNTYLMFPFRKLRNYTSNGLNTTYSWTIKTLNSLSSLYRNDLHKKNSHSRNRSWKWVKVAAAERGMDFKAQLSNFVVEITVLFEVRRGEVFKKGGGRFSKKEGGVYEKMKLEHLPNCKNSQKRHVIGKRG